MRHAFCKACCSDGHMALANTAALKAAGVNRNVKNIEGGSIQRSAGGDLTGIFRFKELGVIASMQPWHLTDDGRWAEKSISQEFLSMITRNFIPAAEMRAIYHRIFRTELDKMTQYKPVYTELFMVGDSLFLFDFAKFSIIRFTKEGIQTGETPMRIVFNNDWERRMHRDAVTGRFYLEFLNGQLSYLIELDPKTGDEARKIPVPMYKHIDHIKIINNRIYFLHQPDIGDRGKKLYYFDI